MPCPVNNARKVNDRTKVRGGHSFNDCVRMFHKSPVKQKDNFWKEVASKLGSVGRTDYKWIESEYSYTSPFSIFSLDI